MDEETKEILSTAIIDVIVQLLNHLPDSDVHDDETWNWCWDELSCNAQDAVKAARRSANELLLMEGRSVRTDAEH